MRIQKRQWAVWDKRRQKFVRMYGSLVVPDKEIAWLRAHKERKDSPYKVVQVKVSIQSKK